MTDQSWRCYRSPAPDRGQGDGAALASMVLEFLKAHSGEGVTTMWTLLAKAIRGLAIVLAGIGVVFVVGMRRKWPVVLNAVRRSSRATKRLPMKTAGTLGADASVIRHVGRRTGRTYETPVRAVTTSARIVPRNGASPPSPASAPVTAATT